jgi:hypothetical protein
MKTTKTMMLLCAASVLTFYFGGCKKDVPEQNQASADASAQRRADHVRMYSSESAQKWMKMEIQIMQTTPGLSNLAIIRPYAYSGIVMYESLLPGMPSYQTLSGQLTGLPAMPSTSGSLNYHWAESMNAAMAKILRLVYPTMSAANIFSVDSLENVLYAGYSLESDVSTIARSHDFGQAVAQIVNDWALTDGNAHLADAYVVPTGAGLWIPTPPAFAPSPAGAYWGNLRQMVNGSGAGAQPPAPPAYSEIPGSDFYNMVQHVYDVSQTLTQSQIDQGMYWRDIPGLTTCGHYLSILQQVLQQENSNLETAAYAYALTAIICYDASISTWQTKYTYTLIRPVSYIRSVLGHSSWNPLLTTPNHPEYSSAHASLSSGEAVALTSIFGENHSFTDHSYDYLGFPARSFNSFNAFGEDAGNSRLFAGIHYQNSIDQALIQGRKVAHNIMNTIVLKKL